MREAADDYLRRLRRYIGTREVEVREASREPTIPAQRDAEAARLAGGKPAGSGVGVRGASREPTIPAQRDAEAARLAERMPAGSRLVALAREGQGWTSAELA